MNISIKKISASVIAGAILSMPLLGMAQIGIPCGGPGQAECGFNDLLILANNIIHFIIFSVAVPLAALGFMWAGAGLVLNQNKESAWSEAKGRFSDIAMGFGIILAAFVLVKTILYAFLNTKGGFTLFLFQ